MAGVSGIHQRSSGGAPVRVVGTFTAPAQVSAAQSFDGSFSLYIGGTFGGGIILERSPDAGSSWYPCSLDPSGTVAEWLAPASVDVAAICIPNLYRLRCTALSTGAINYTMLQSTVPA
jgi:hypothetical protein